MPEQFPATADVKVKADLTGATTELAKGIRHGGGIILEALCGPRLAKVRADAQRAEAQAAVDDQLIRAGLARHENGQMVYLTDAANCARFLACSRDQRRVKNLSACLEEAAKAIDKDPTFSLPGKDIDLDFLDDWQDKAERNNSDYMRTLWGRILKGELQRPGTYSRRTLEILYSLSMQEAELFAKIARYSILGTVMLPYEYDAVFCNSSLLKDSRLFSSAIKLGRYININGRKNIYLPGHDCGFCLYFSKEHSGNIMTFSGYILSNVGEELLAIPDIEPISDMVLKVFFESTIKILPDLIKITAHPFSEDKKAILPEVLCQYPPTV